MGKKSGSGMNNPDHISERVQIFKFFVVDLGSGMEKNSAPGSGKGRSRIRDPG
jgi:hypothetical protein